MRTPCGRPHHRVVVVVCALLVWGCERQRDPTSKGEPPPEFSPAEVAVELGVGGVQDLSQWNLLTVQLTNRRGNFDGKLRINGRTIDPRSGERMTLPVTYDVEVEIPRGETRSIRLPVRPENWIRVQIRLETRGKTWRFRVTPQFSEPVDARVLVIASKTSRSSAALFTPFARSVEEVLSQLRATETPDRVTQTPGRVSLTTNVGGTTTVSGAKPKCRVARIDDDELPPFAVAYDPFELVILYGSALIDADREQIEALAEWVRGGGTLVVFPGSEWTAGLRSAEFQDLLGVRTDGSGERLPVSKDLLVHNGFGALQEKLHLGEGARSLHDGLAITARRGAGRTITFRLLPSWEKLPTAAEFPALHEILKGAVTRGTSFVGEPGPGLREIERAAPSILFGMSGFSVPPWEQVALGIVIYLSIGFFVPAFVFRRHRREWTFAVVILTAILAVVGIYRYGLLGSLEEREIEETTILRLHDDVETAEATSFLGVIGPSLDRVTMDVRPRSSAGDTPDESSPAELESPPAPEVASWHVLPQPLRGMVASGDWQHQVKELTMRPTTVHAELPSLYRFSYRLGAQTLYPNAMRFYRFDYRVSVGALIGIDCDPYDGGDRLAVTVTNGFDDPLWLYVVREGRARQFETVGPGESRHLSCPVVPDGSWADSFRVPDSVRRQLYGNYYFEQDSSRKVLQTLPPDPYQTVAALAALKMIATPRAELEQNVSRNFFGGTVGTSGGSRSRDDPPEPTRPAYLVATTRAPIFPASDETLLRRGNVVLIYELPVGAFDG